MTNKHCFLRKTVHISSHTHFFWFFILIFITTKTFLCYILLLYWCVDNVYCVSQYKYVLCLALGYCCSNSVNQFTYRPAHPSSEVLLFSGLYFFCCTLLILFFILILNFLGLLGNFKPEVTFIFFNHNVTFLTDH